MVRHRKLIMDYDLEQRALIDLELTNRSIDFMQAFAGGAVLMMLANTMFPEAYVHCGKLTGIFVVVGFMLSVGIVLLERT